MGKTQKIWMEKASSIRVIYTDRLDALCSFVGIELIWLSFGVLEIVLVDVRTNGFRERERVVRW